MENNNFIEKLELTFPKKKNLENSTLVHQLIFLRDRTDTFDDDLAQPNLIEEITGHYPLNAHQLKNALEVEDDELQIKIMPFLFSCATGWDFEILKRLNFDNSSKRIYSMCLYWFPYRELIENYLNKFSKIELRKNRMFQLSSQKKLNESLNRMEFKYNGVPRNIEFQQGKSTFLYNTIFKSRFNAKEVLTTMNCPTI